jgi:hypothetical protein
MTPARRRSQTGERIRPLPGQMFLWLGLCATCGTVPIAVQGKRTPRVVCQQCGGPAEEDLRCGCQG